MLGFGALSESAVSELPAIDVTGDRLPAPQKTILREEFLANPHVMLVDSRIVSYLDAHPEDVFSLSAWQFQELIAEVLARFDYDVELGPRGRDGGVDVFARRRSAVGAELVLVQCKRNAPDNKVGQPVVKQLVADVQLQNATRGLVVTTSSFTRPALATISQWHFRLAGVDNAALAEWIRRVKD